MIHTRDQKRFTISEVAADLHELMIITTAHYVATHTSKQLDPHCNPPTCHSPNQPHRSHPTAASYYSIPILWWVGGWVFPTTAEQVSNLLKVAAVTFKPKLESYESDTLNQQSAFIYYSFLHFKISLQYDF